MSGEPSQQRSDCAEEAWSQIDELVGEIARLAKSELPPSDFFTALLDRVVSGLAASGGILWNRGAQGSLLPQYHVHHNETRFAEDRRQRDCHRRLAESVLGSGQARVVLPHASLGEEETLNPSEFLLVLCPWKVNDDCAGVVEVFQRPTASPKSQQGNLRFLEVVGELVIEYHRNRQLREFRDQSARLSLFQQFTERVHRSLDLKTAAYEIANEGRRFLDCDRVSVLGYRGSKCSILAVSGVDTFSRRANIIRRIERLCTAVAPTGQSLWYPSAVDDLPPKIQDRLHAYLDESHVRTIAVVPLLSAGGEEARGRPRLLGALVVEKFYGDPDDRLRGTLEVVRSHGTLALQNAMELHDIPLSGLFRGVGRARRSLSRFWPAKFLVLLLAVAAGGWALARVPADFQIEARGELQPCRLRDVFAPDDGVISDLRTEHGEPVKANQMLVMLRKPELDLEWKRVDGELQTAQKRLIAVGSERLRNPREGEMPRDRHGELTAQEEELRQLIRGLQEQLQILQRQLADLEVRSPIDGAVVTWNLRQLLESRPVSRGQILMTLADLAGPWQLELRIPDRRVAHVLAAQREIGAGLDVFFTLATDPGLKLRGKLQSMGMRTELGESHEAFVLAKVAIDRRDIPELIPGTTVVTKIHCGRRPVGYVWLHELIDTVRTWMLF
jgi:multidrug efflux pump subunit AcrA (membrane-fusion protein)